MSQQRRLWITVPDEIHTKLDQISESTGVSRSVIVERVLAYCPDLMQWAGLRLSSDAVKNSFKKIA